MIRRLLILIGISLAFGLGLASPRAASAADPRLVIAVIGDYGSCAVSCKNEQAVANLVHGWGPGVIMTVGDNSYESGTAAEVPLDQAPYAADVRAGRFYEIAGNHDWGNTCNPQAIVPSTTYFGRPPHYSAHFGNGLLDLFATDMNCGDPGGDSATSAQASWYRGEVAASRAIWKITADHQAFYGSGEHGTQAYTHWAILPSVDLFLSGHDHDFEHLVEGGQNFVVDGVGGRNLVGMGAPVPGSLWRDSTHFGAVRLTVTRSSLTVEFINVSGVVEHEFTLTRTGASGGDTTASSQTGSAPLPSSSRRPGAAAAVTRVASTPVAASTQLEATPSNPAAAAEIDGVPRTNQRSNGRPLDTLVLAGALGLLVVVGVTLYRRFGHN